MASINSLKSSPLLTLDQNVMCVYPIPSIKVHLSSTTSTVKFVHNSSNRKSDGRYHSSGDDTLCYVEIKALMCVHQSGV